MKAARIWTGEKQRKLGSICLSTALAVLIGGLASMPARADDDDRGRNVRQEHHDRARHPVRHIRRMDHRYEAPRYVYAPPPVYYVAPPRQPAVDFIFPLNFR